MNTDINIIENFLSQEDFKVIQQTIYSSNITWARGRIHSGYPLFHFCHHFYSGNEPVSNYFGMLAPCLGQLQALSLIRIKANLLTRTDVRIINPLHTDVNKAPPHCKTAILYLNTNDGYTCFEDMSKVDSVANRVVIFPTNLKHAGTTNTDKDIQDRCVINFNYFELEREKE